MAARLSCGLGPTEHSRPRLELCPQRGRAPTLSPDGMLIFWALSASLLPALVLASGSQPCPAAHYSSALESLECYNDYSTHIRCSWRESKLNLSQAPLSLFHLGVNDSESQCKPIGPTDSPPAGGLEVRRQCQYNTTAFFVLNKDSYFFKTPHSPGLSKTLNVSQLAVRVRPPKSLSQGLTKGGGRELRWRSYYHPTSPIYPTLNYELAYRRLDQDWVVLEVSQNESWVIEWDRLVPGCVYEARVRCRGGRGLWSDWSPLVTWRTEEVSVPGPYNLQCVFDGVATMNCSWEVKSELAQFVTYNLFYRSPPTAPAIRCCFDTPVRVDTSVLVQNCNFSISQQEQVVVELVPSRNTRQIQSSKHIRPTPPGNIKVQEKEGNWVLSWTAQKSSTVPISFEVQYWRSQSPEEKINISESGLSHLIRESSLLPFTRYTAQVCSVITPNRSTYDGLPSDWTEHVHWTTPPARWSLVNILVPVISVCVAVLFLWFAIPACRRRVNMWKMSIPSPFKSKVLEEFRKKSTNDSSAYENEVERAPVSETEVLDMVQAVQYFPPGVSMWKMSSLSPFKSKVLEEFRKKSTNDSSAYENEVERAPVSETEVLDMVQEVQYFPQFSASEDPRHRLLLTASQEVGPYQQVPERGSGVAANASLSGPSLSHSAALGPQNAGAVSGPCMPDTASLSSLPTNQEMALEYVEVPPPEGTLLRDVSSMWWKGGMEVQDIVHECPLLGPADSETELRSAPESLDLDPYAYIPIPFKIHSMVIQQSPDCCPLPDVGTDDRGTATTTEPPAWCCPGGLGENGEGWMEYMKEDYTYANLSQV
ncbi:cytokine receptor common subunit beta-like [Conger conger]|uniref:cytokine receptor common subunit beta-like n=1 Tax=Conger conger TaxID=82655 RepID=UPI002A5A0C8F|nr:cytokine receptor common subunit beta-like [Conger conger]